MTQFIDLEADFDIGERSLQPPKAKSRPIIIVGSLLVHGLVLFLLFYFSGFTSKSLQSDQQPEIAAIKATLYFPPPAPVVTPVETPTEQALVEEQQAEKVAEEVPEPVPEPEVTEPDISEPPIVEQDAPKPEVAEPLPTETAANQDSAAETNAVESQQQDSAARMERLNRALSNHLNSLHEQQVTEMSQDASRNWQQDYYQRQTSGYKPPPQAQDSERGTINEEYTENMMKTGIEMSDAHQSMFKAKEVDCSNTASEVLTSLSGVFGGRIKCSDSPDFQKYIDARLKKK